MTTPELRRERYNASSESREIALRAHTESQPQVPGRIFWMLIVVIAGLIAAFALALH